MPDQRPIQSLLRRFRWLPLATVVMSLLILGAVIASTTLVLRGQLRRQMAGMDGRVLNAVAQVHATTVQKDLAELGGLEDPDNQLMVLLETSRHKDVLGARLFDADGRFVESFPPRLLEARLDPADVRDLRFHEPLSHFYPFFKLQNLFYPDAAPHPAATSAIPLLEVNVPLHASEDGRLVGIAQFLIEGQRLRAELARLDRQLWRLAGIIYLAAGILLVLALGSAFRRLRRTQVQLADRTESLLRANEELALAAKTSAVGAVASHLIHGLRNPLAGLQNLVTSLRTQTDRADQDDWEAAAASTRRMQTMINQVVGVLREQETSRFYQVRPAELVDIVERNIRPLLDSTGVRWQPHVRAEGSLTNREGHLLTLIVLNLLQNAIEATPRGGLVTMSITENDQSLTLEVSDEGPGFPASLRAQLFAPCASTKEGGSGIGLAITRLLASHLGAQLSLQSSTDQGCVFRIVLPRAAAGEDSKVASIDVLG